MAEKNNGFVPGFAGMRGLKHVREKYLRTSMIRDSGATVFGSV